MNTTTTPTPCPRTRCNGEMRNGTGLVAMQLLNRNRNEAIYTLKGVVTNVTKCSDCGHSIY